MTLLICFMASAALNGALLAFYMHKTYGPNLIQLKLLNANSENARLKADIERKDLEIRMLEKDNNEFRKIKESDSAQSSQLRVM